jgi:hypothetical protein
MDCLCWNVELCLVDQFWVVDYLVPGECCFAGDDDSSTDSPFMGGADAMTGPWCFVSQPPLA